MAQQHKIRNEDATYSFCNLLIYYVSIQDIDNIRPICELNLGILSENILLLHITYYNIHRGNSVGHNAVLDTS